MTDLMTPDTIRSITNRIIKSLPETHAKYDILFLSHLTRSLYTIAQRYIGRDLTDTFSQSPDVIKGLVQRNLTAEILEELKKL